MGLKSMLFLAVVLLPSLLAITVTFDNGESAEYKLLEVEDGQLLHGVQGVVLFAEVVSSPQGYVFQKGIEVALKIGFAEKEEEMRREQKAHNFIRDKDPTGSIGVVKAEISLGKSVDINEDTNFVLPDGNPKQKEYFILIMERMGKDLIDKYKEYPISYAQQEAIYDQVCVILGQLKSIGFVQGDIKLPNILLITNDVNGGVKLADLGLSVFEGSDMVKCAGDQYYASPIQCIIGRPANHDDCKVSLAYSFTFLALGDLPWINYIQDSKRKIKDQECDLHIERTLLAKHEFNLDPFATFQDGFPETLQKKISDTIKTATGHEIGSIQKEMDHIKNAIRNSKKNGQIPNTANLLTKLQLN